MSTTQQEQNAPAVLHHIHKCPRLEKLVLYFYMRHLILLLVLYLSTDIWKTVESSGVILIFFYLNNLTKASCLFFNLKFSALSASIASFSSLSKYFVSMYDGRCKLS